MFKWLLLRNYMSDWPEIWCVQSVSISLMMKGYFKSMTSISHSDCSTLVSLVWKLARN